MVLNGLTCAEMPLRIYSLTLLTHSPVVHIGQAVEPTRGIGIVDVMRTVIRPKLLLCYYNVDNSRPELLNEECVT